MKIKEYIENDKLNIEKVMDEYTGYLYTVIKNKNLQLIDEDIEEIVSDVFLAVWKNQSHLDINKDMSSYLSGIAKNVYCKKIRKLKNESDINDYENVLCDNENFEKKIEDKQKSNVIIEEINNMKQEDKDIFVLYYYYSKTIKEIAKILAITEPKVKSRLFRIRKKLKKNLEKRGYSYYE